MVCSDGELFLFEHVVTFEQVRSVVLSIRLVVGIKSDDIDTWLRIHWDTTALRRRYSNRWVISLIAEV